MDCTERRFLLAAIKQALDRPLESLEWFDSVTLKPDLDVVHFVAFDSGYISGQQVGRQIGAADEHYREKLERRKAQRRRKANRSRR